MRGSLIKPGTTPPHAAAHETGKDRIDARRIGAVPLHTLDGDKTIYVAKSGSDETGDGSEAKPFASIQKAVDTVTPGVWVGGNVNINIEAGEYGEDVVIEGFKSTNGYLQLNSKRNEVHIHSLATLSSEVIYVYNMTLTQNENLMPGLFFKNCQASVYSTNVTKPSVDPDLSFGPCCIAVVDNSVVLVQYLNLTGGGIGIYIYGSQVTVHNTHISESGRGVDLSSGLLIYGYNNVNTATTQRYIQSGAQIIELSN